jgi:hypothetical protein
MVDVRRGGAGVGGGRRGEAQPYRDGDENCRDTVSNAQRDFP